MAVKNRDPAGIFFQIIGNETRAPSSGGFAERFSRTYSHGAWIDIALEPLLLQVCSLLGMGMRLLLFRSLPRAQPALSLDVMSVSRTSGWICLRRPHANLNLAV